MRASLWLILFSSPTILDSGEDALDSLLYSYKRSINGFAALLTEDEARLLSGKCRRRWSIIPIYLSFLLASIADLLPSTIAREEVVSAFPSEGRSSPHTTRSWEFILHEEGVKGGLAAAAPPPPPKPGRDVIVGMLDSGLYLINLWFEFS